jgi:hypothetical protein
MNIVMVASRAFPTIKAGMDLCELLGTFDRSDTIHTRTAVGGGDAFIAEAATVMGFTVRRWKGEGGASNYIRDVEMVKQANVVYAFFGVDSVGEGGTQHVIDKSLDQHKRTYSYVWDGRLVLVGSSDGSEGESDVAAEPAGWIPEVPGEATSEPLGTGREGPPRRGLLFASGARGEDDSGGHP